jgi:hypothetical protein
MSRNVKMATLAALLVAVAAPEIAFAQQAIFLPPSYTWRQSEMSNRGDNAVAQVGAPTHNRGPQVPVPYGQW